MGRFLRSKHLRYALWKAADGRCEQCGCDLPEDWHADHTIPWVLTHDTNVHDMQALCPACDLQKGASLSMDFTLRRHQKLMLDKIQRITTGMSAPHIIYSDVAPGGGKTLLAIIAATRLKHEGLIDKLCWVVPRLALREQAVKDFLEYQQTLGYREEVRGATNEKDPSRGLFGYVTTYDALRLDSSGFNRDEFRRHRYLLIADEPHHIAEGSANHDGIQPLYELATMCHWMSGTFERHDKRQIAYVPYIDIGDGSGLQVDNRENEDQWWISYSIQDALEDKALIPLYFDFCDGSARWIDPEGETQTADSLDSPEAIYAALDTDYAFALLSQCVTRWKKFREVGDRASLLVVCYSIRQARKITEWLITYAGIDARVAVSDDTPQALQNIRAFKQQECPALVTVGMAYEGLDVLHITHIACLTHIRSAPWILQMLARAWRYDRKSAVPWEQQFASVYVPDDPLMRLIVAYIRGAMNRAYKQREAPGGPEEREWPPPPPPPPPTFRKIIGLDSTLTQTRGTEFGGTELSAEATAQLMAFQRAEPAVQHLHPVILDRVLRRYQHFHEEPPPEATASPGKDANEREKHYRGLIEEKTRHVDNVRGLAGGTTNREIMAIFRKKREDMKEAELLIVLQHVIRTYREWL